MLSRAKITVGIRYHYTMWLEQLEWPSDIRVNIDDVIDRRVMLRPCNYSAAGRYWCRLLSLNNLLLAPG